MAVEFTDAQKRRLTELNSDVETSEQTFEDEGERNRIFRQVEKDLVQQRRKDLDQLLGSKRVGVAQKIQDDLSRWLTEEEGFTRVSTPTIITSGQLDKMTITGDHALRSQVFWVDRKHCLRPMLAPNLYEVMRDLHGITGEPVRIFEIGSCFRKESQGAKHMNEFTMLNLVELAAGEDGYQMARLEELARSAMKAVGISEYDLVKETSTVYEETLDIEVGGVEVASGSFGPHPLDDAWGVFDTWVGIGLGIERLALTKSGARTIRHVGKSTSYLDGVPLKL